MNPTVLYHGSGFNHTELKPGYKRTGKLVSWDVIESNKFLYATTDRNTAIELGFASAIEKKYLLDRFNNTDSELIIQLSDEKLPSINDLLGIDIYLYEISFDEEDGWVRNVNEHNHLTTEYKTEKTIKSNLIKVDKIDMESWLKHKRIKIFGKKPGYHSW
jgi:hypothetical protein